MRIRPSLLLHMRFPPRPTADSLHDLSETPGDPVGTIALSAGFVPDSKLRRTIHAGQGRETRKWDFRTVTSAWLTFYLSPSFQLLARTIRDH